MGSRGKEMSWGVFKRVKLLFKVILAVKPPNNEIWYYCVMISHFLYLPKSSGYSLDFSYKLIWLHWFERKRPGLAPAFLAFLLPLLNKGLVCATCRVPSYLGDLPLNTPFSPCLPAKSLLMPPSSVSSFLTLLMELVTLVCASIYFICSYVYYSVFTLHCDCDFN